MLFWPYRFSKPSIFRYIENIIKIIPPPKGDPSFTRALVFDSKYDQYKGIINYVRIFDGEMHKELKDQLEKCNVIGDESKVDVRDTSKKLKEKILAKKKRNLF